jgi:hypothetical protein
MSLDRSVSIPGYDVQGGDGKEFVVFKIMVVIADNTWFIKRRYQDFIVLHTAVKKLVAPDLLPPLPPKRIRMGIAKFDPDFLEERRSSLEKYLVRVLAIIGPERSETWDDFLEFAPHALDQCIDLLRVVEPLQHVVHRLKSLRASVNESSRQSMTSSSARKVAASIRRRTNSDSSVEDDADGPIESSSHELLDLLKGSVRTMADLVVVLRDEAFRLEHETADAKTKRNGLLSALRIQEQEVSDVQRMLEALRQTRAREIEKERGALVVFSVQSRKLAAEVCRCWSECRLMELLIADHTLVVAKLRKSLSSWEKSERESAHGHNQSLSDLHDHEHIPATVGHKSSGSSPLLSGAAGPSVGLTKADLDFVAAISLVSFASSSSHFSSRVARILQAIGVVIERFPPKQSGKHRIFELGVPASVGVPKDNGGVSSTLAEISQKFPKSVLATSVFSPVQMNAAMLLEQIVADNIKLASISSCINDCRVTNLRETSTSANPLASPYQPGMESSPVADARFTAGFTPELNRKNGHGGVSGSNGNTAAVDTSQHSQYYLYSASSMHQQQLAGSAGTPVLHAHSHSTAGYSTPVDAPTPGGRTRTAGVALSTTKDGSGPSTLSSTAVRPPTNASVGGNPFGTPPTGRTANLNNKISGTGASSLNPNFSAATSLIGSPPPAPPRNAPSSEAPTSDTLQSSSKRAPPPAARGNPFESMSPSPAMTATTAAAAQSNNPSGAGRTFAGGAVASPGNPF